MINPFSTLEITEGGTGAIVHHHSAASTRGPASRRITPVFYNPAMALSRDVGVMVMQALLTRSTLPRGAWLDGLAATGLRGLRLANEVGGAPVVLNDHNPIAVELMERNVELNHLSRGAGSGQVEVTRSRLQTILSEGRYAMIDIDPFGTPAPFIDSALQALVQRGVLALTATDLPLLCGAQPRACIRRYGARPLRGPACNEVGLRVLVGWAARRAAAYDLAVEPLLGYFEGHHLRAYLRIHRGAGRADRALEQVGYLEQTTGWDLRPLASRASGASAGLDGGKIGGPLWLGPLAEPKLLEGMVVNAGLARADLASRYLTLWRGEYAVPSPCGFHTVDQLARAAGRGPPSPLALVETLQGQGHRATRTHFSPTGVRTSASWTQVMEALDALEAT